ncbi:MAG: hypothetical protein RL490_957 [Pseudomonadota bacterium]|jgi:predicted alpha/beta superfamily hydrolase
MITRRSLIAAAALLPMTARAGESIQFSRLPMVAGAGLKPRHIDVWQPPGSEGQALPLLLMHDGQNLFEPASSYGGKTWQVAEAVMALVAAGTIPPVMIAGVWNSGDQRWRDYVPKQLLDRLPPALAADFRNANGGGSLSDAYVAFLADVALPLLRQRHAIKPGKVTIMGSSMGGLASLNAVIRRPDVFAAAGCVSTHWPVFAPQPAAAPGIETAITAWLRDDLGAPAGRRLWFDHGDQTLDQYYAPFQAVADAALVRAGWQQPRDFTSRAYPGAAHDEPSWAKRVADPLTFLFKTKA